ncbi:unnamed protein product [Adineta steineri]|uniref:Translation elongation factor EF1B beta/delta subunit guanine nucleotide exchange domain-containing protein n=1 Tax=Adineta steineri TaxID=433720 RepID=A0A813MT39_9BILA|nr:unnamed protein product [Adineta steineri]CAF0796217.1 unnamed protein product [Adineta steineri]
MAENLIHINNWFSKYEIDRAEQLHYSVFDTLKSTPTTTTSYDLDNEKIKKTNTSIIVPLNLVVRSTINFDIKPWDEDTDIDAMEQAVRSIKFDGLVWGQSKRVPYAFGIVKLQMTCVIEDDKIATDLIEDKIYELDQYVQSVDIPCIHRI